jgi:hypothetical protein
MRYRRWRPPPIMGTGDADRFFRPDVDRHLELRRDDRVFTIGSCFARNVEAYLVPHVRVPSRVTPAQVPADIAAMHGGLTKDMVLWHRYNVFSIRNSLEWALTPEHPSARHRLVHIDSDHCLDPYAGCRIVLSTAEAERVRDWVDATIASVRTCRVIIITLGLSEVWADRETGLVMNGPPLKEMWQRYPSRFEFRVASFAETFEQLEGIHAILARHCVDGFQIVVTVSPIPLAATFREMDIVVANAASKAILRAAADQWSDQHDDVHYFPSYEMILNSAPEGVWTADFRHCQIGILERVMTVFLCQFATLDSAE